MSYNRVFRILFLMLKEKTMNIFDSLKKKSIQQKNHIIEKKNDDTIRASSKNMNIWVLTSPLHRLIWVCIVRAGQGGWLCNECLALEIVNLNFKFWKMNCEMPFVIVLLYNLRNTQDFHSDKGGNENKILWTHSIDFVTLTLRKKSFVEKWKIKTCYH